MGVTLFKTGFTFLNRVVENVTTIDALVLQKYVDTNSGQLCNTLSWLCVRKSHPLIAEFRDTA